MCLTTKNKFTTVTVDTELDEMEISGEPEGEKSVKRHEFEQIFLSDPVGVMEESHSKDDLNLREDVEIKEKINSNEDPKENLDLKEDLKPEENLNPKEQAEPKEDQPSHTNRWSLQEHPNKGTPVRSSPSLGSIPKHKRASKCSKDELSDLPETWDEECQKHLVDFAERYRFSRATAV